MKWWLFFLAAVVFGVSSAQAATQPSADLTAKGRYLFALGGCGNCHTAKGGPENAGGRPVEIPGGIVYSTNITPDKETGIGSWTDAQIVASIRLGVRPSGQKLIPAMPYTSFSGMADEDLRALVAYLRTLKPVRNPNRPEKVKLPFLRTIFIPLWYRIYFRPLAHPIRAPEEGPPRGEYLASSVGHCTECHTPRGLNGVPKRALYLAGNPQEIEEGSLASNITPDKKTGIGDWSQDEIEDYLRTGFRPDGDTAQGLMAELIKGGFKEISPADAKAIAAYLKQVPAISHLMKKK